MGGFFDEDEKGKWSDATSMAVVAGTVGTVLGLAWKIANTLESDQIEGSSTDDQTLPKNPPTSLPPL
eukprot:g83023.t1